MIHIECASQAMEAVMDAYCRKLSRPTGVLDVVTDYGARNDDDPNSDASGAINNALQDAAEGHSKKEGYAVYIPPGKYNTRKAILLPRHTYLFGAGIASEIRFRGNGSHDERTAMQDEDSNSVRETITVKDLYLVNACTYAPPPRDDTSIRDVSVGVDCGNSIISYFHRLSISGFSIGLRATSRKYTKNAYNWFSSISV